MPWRSLSVIVGDGARAFRCLAPMAFAEASAHTLVAHDAIDQVTAAARQACLHRLPRLRPACFAGLRIRRSDWCDGKVPCYRGSRAHGCPQPGRRGLTHACTLCGGDGHRGLTRACALRGGNGHRGYTRACALCGGNGHRGLTRTCALRCHGVGRGDWRIEDGSCLGFHRLRLHRHRQSRRRCGCVLLTGTDRLRGDSHRIGRRRINAVRGIGTRDQDRREGSQAPARSQRRGGQLRLLHGCRDADVAWCWPRRCRVSGWQHWRRIRRGE